MPLQKKRVSNTRLTFSTASNHDPMGDERNHRVHDALSSLVNHLLPQHEDEDNATLDERRDEALDLVNSIIDR